MSCASGNTAERGEGKNDPICWGCVIFLEYTITKEKIWYAWCQCSRVCNALEGNFKHGQPFGSFLMWNNIPVLSLQPCKRKGSNWPLFFVFLGAIFDFNTGFPQRYTLTETLSMLYEKCKWCPLFESQNNKTVVLVPQNLFNSVVILRICNSASHFQSNLYIFCQGSGFYL